MTIKKSRGQKNQLGVDELELTKYQRDSYKIFGDIAKKWLKKEQTLETNLLYARFQIRAEAYMAYVLTSAFVSIIVGIIVLLLHLFIFSSMPYLSIPIIKIMIYLSPMLFFVMTYLLLMSAPSIKASERKKNIDMNLPYATNFIAAMASANVNPASIFKGLSKQTIYGEVQKEALWIIRDIELLGKDFITALRDAIERTPSQKFQDFLQGIIVTSISGGELKSFFIQKSESYMSECIIDQKRLLETLGILAETFVIVVVAMPLFLIVMMSVFMMTEAEGGTSASYLYMIIYFMTPASQVGFIFCIKSTVPMV